MSLKSYTYEPQSLDAMLELRGAAAVRLFNYSDDGTELSNATATYDQLQDASAADVGYTFAAGALRAGQLVKYGGVIEIVARGADTIGFQIKLGSNVIAQMDPVAFSAVGHVCFQGWFQVRNASATGDIVFGCNWDDMQDEAAGGAGNCGVDLSVDMTGTLEIAPYYVTVGSSSTDTVALQNFWVQQA